MFESGGWAALRQELHRLSEIMLNKPREHRSLLILSELAAVASQWDEPTREIAREFARVALSWAVSLNEEIESPTTTPQAALELRAMQCMFYMYSMVSCCTGELNDSDVELLCQGAILAEHKRLFEDPTPHDDVVRALTVVSSDVMARQLPEVLRVLDANPQMLTVSVKLIDESTPGDLEWTRMVAPDGTMTMCFQAVHLGLNARLFSVNVQTGVLLFNGLPPQRLPTSILKMPLYLRTFGDRNFVRDRDFTLGFPRSPSRIIYTPREPNLFDLPRRKFVACRVPKPLAERQQRYAE